MDLSNILFQTFIMVLVTSLSGSMIVKIWLAYALRLESAGCWHLFNYGIRSAILFWGLPLVYMILMLAGKSFSFWGGVLFQLTPVIYYFVMAIGIIWLSGAMILAGKYILAGIGAYKYYCKRIPHKDDWGIVCKDICRRLQIRRKIPVYGCYEAQIPVIRGLFRPMIVLPEHGYNNEELRVILTHELTHYRHRDLWLKALFTSILCLQWFNPLPKEVYKKFCFWSECYCDASAAPVVGGAKLYFAEILAFTQKQERLNLMGGTGLLEDEHELLRRVSHMSKQRNAKKVPKQVAAAMCAGIICLSAGSVFAATGTLAAGYQQLYYATMVEDITPEDSAIDWLESEDFGPAPGVIVISDVADGARVKANGTFEWTVKNNVQKQTGTFYVASGKTITATAVFDPADVSVKLGIIKPNGARTACIGSDSLTKSYTADKSGYYQVFVENTSGVSVDVYGSYSTR